MKNKIARKEKISKKIKQVSDRIRVVVYKSLKYDYLQAIDDKNGETLAGLSTKKFSKEKSDVKTQKFAQEFAEALSKKNIKQIVFDRRGYKYHGRIKAICDELRKNGIKF